MYYFKFENMKKIRHVTGTQLVNNALLLLAYICLWGYINISLYKTLRDF